MKKKFLALMICFTMLFALSSCSSSAQDEGQTPTAPPPGTSALTTASPLPDLDVDAETIIFTDSTGREVEVPTDISRVAASGSLAQIVLFSLAPDMLIGLAGKWFESAEQFIDPQYYDLPVLGQFYGSDDLNLEEIAAQDPQVIIDIGESKSSIIEDMDGIMEQVGIPTIHIEASIDTMADAYRQLGKLLNMETEAEELAIYCETVIARTHEIADKANKSGKVDLVYCAGEDGLSVIANGSFHAEVIDLLSNNLAVVADASSKGNGDPIDMEQLLNWDPDVIIFAPGSAYETIGSDSTWQQLRAISGGKYYEVPEGPYNWMGFPPSVNRYLGMIWMAQLLYPDAANYDMFEETSKFYELFYHSTLTKDQYSELVANSLVS